MRRSQFIAVSVVVAAALGVALWLTFREEPEGPPEIGVATTPVAEQMDPVRIRMLDHDPWPYREFEREISELRHPAARTDIDPVWEADMHRGPAFDTRISIHLKDATTKEIIDEFKRQLKDVHVFTYDVPDLDDLRFTLDVTDMRSCEVIDELRAQSKERFRYYLTTQGLALGSERCIQQ
ncbi:MAG: hypothetical protein K8T90_11095, partial [Planctomycetes bacterium]|nr:hypothetical protein [Planctomycetota bacterium]